MRTSQHTCGVNTKCYASGKAAAVARERPSVRGLRFVFQLGWHVKLVFSAPVSREMGSLDGTSGKPKRGPVWAALRLFLDSS